MTRDSDSDSRKINIDTSGKTSLRDILSRRGFLGVCAAALAAKPAVEALDEDDENEDDDGDDGGEDEQDGDDADDNKDDKDGEDEEPFAEVVFDDQPVQRLGDRAAVQVKKYEANSGGYISIHRYSRFAFAEGEDPDDYDVPVPEELENPICESLIGITEFFEPGEYRNVEVPLFREDSPAVELDAAEEGEQLEESQPLICIPHLNSTDPDEFNCPDDPDTPDFQENPDEVDGAFGNGPRDVEDIGVSHDLALVFDGTDDLEQIKTAKRQLELIREGVLVPQPFD